MATLNTNEYLTNDLENNALVEYNSPNKAKNHFNSKKSNVLQGSKLFKVHACKAKKKSLCVID